MSWMSMLYQTYEANKHLAGKADEKVPLPLPAHMAATAQIEITLDLDGNFQRASVLAKEDGRTMIPVTEASASRASGIAPHALCDNLSYVAGDLIRFLPNAKKAEEKHENYAEQLREWCESDCAHPKVRAVYRYIAQKCMTADLIRAGILETEDGRLTAKKVSGQPCEKALVRFRILGTEPEGVFEDPSLFDRYTNYYFSRQPGQKDICYLSGERETAAANHPKGIVAAKYNAKLLSANDTQNFTFRGRFATAGEACAVGYGASQKVHGALTWLAAKQGIVVGTKDKRTYICWNPKGKPTVNFRDVNELFETEPEDEQKEAGAFTEESYQYRLKNTLAGYRNELADNDDIVIMGLDAATTGRLAILYYNELKASDFYDRIEKWYAGCAWYNRIYGEGKSRYAVQSPKLERIVDCGFGIQRESSLKTDDRVMKEQVQRLIFCMLDGQPIPWDMVQALWRRASMPLAYTRGNRERLLFTACAVIRKYYNDIGKGDEVTLKLDENNHDRSYLFGRLLAIGEYVERSTFDREETREPNAIQLQNAFTQHPMKTWSVIEGALLPYFQKLPPGLRLYCKHMITEIMVKVREEDQNRLNHPLNEKYLIGYYLQRKELYTKKER